MNSTGYHPMKTYFSATTRLVTTIFAMASGRRNFQPKAISWS